MGICSGCGLGSCPACATKERIENWEDLEQRTEDAYGISMGDLVREFKKLQMRVQKLETTAVKIEVADDKNAPKKPTAQSRGSHHGH